MNKIQKKSIYFLTETSVDICVEEYLKLDDTEIKLDTPRHLTPFYNNDLDIERFLAAGYPENIVNAVLNMWNVK
jgi:hypothetical protein